jgi:cytochrome c biogenesis protein CcmG/thiol:disulfide interchange protein DsbE
MKKFLPLIILITIATIISIATYNLSKENSPVKEENNFDEKFTKTKISLPEFSLPNLFDEEKNFSNHNLKGKYSVINFFASWCVSCLDEHQLLLELKEKNIINLYGVAWRDIDDNTKKFLNKHGNPYDLVASDSSALFSNIAKINAVPETLITNSDGDIIMFYRGGLTKSLVNQIENLIKNNQE